MVFAIRLTDQLIDLANAIHVFGEKNCMKIVAHSIGFLIIAVFPNKLFGQIHLDTKQKLDAGLVAGELFGNPIKTVA